MREDVLLYNEANAFVVAAGDLAGTAPFSREPEAECFAKGIAKAAFLPIELVQDDPQVLRIVVDEPLSEDEAGEWVARVESALDLNCGELVIAGGTDYVYDHDRSWMEENGAIFRLKVEPGRYRLTVDTHLPGTNGWSAAGLTEGAAGPYWRRTRPGEEMPGWLRYRDDPSFSWNGAEPPALVGFVIRLQRDAAAQPTQDLVEGYPPIGLGARLPKACPRGLPATPVSPKKRPAEDEGAIGQPAAGAQTGRCPHPRGQGGELFGCDRGPSPCLEQAGRSYRRRDGRRRLPVRGQPSERPACGGLPPRLCWALAGPIRGGASGNLRRYGDHDLHSLWRWVLACDGQSGGCLRRPSPRPMPTSGELCLSRRTGRNAS